MRNMVLIVILGLQLETRSPAWKSWNAYSSEVADFLWKGVCWSLLRYTALPAVFEEAACHGGVYSSALLPSLNSNQVNYRCIFLIIISLRSRWWLCTGMDFLVWLTGWEHFHLASSIMAYTPDVCDSHKSSEWSDWYYVSLLWDTEQPVERRNPISQFC